MSQVSSEEWGEEGEDDLAAGGSLTFLQHGGQTAQLVTSCAPPTQGHHIHPHWWSLA